MSSKLSEFNSRLFQSNILIIKSLKVFYIKINVNYNVIQMPIGKILKKFFESLHLTIKGLFN